MEIGQEVYLRPNDPVYEVKAVCPNAKNKGII